MIDVDKVCREWEALGGVATRDGDQGTLYECHRHAHPSGIAAFVNPRRAALYADPESSDTTRLREDVLAALPALAKAWGLTKEPAVLTWDEAAALWVEWGGGSHAEDAVSDARLALGDGRFPIVYWRGDHARFKHRSVLGNERVTLTADTLEDMAEACGLPRTPGRVDPEHNGPQWAIEDVGFEGMPKVTTTPVRRCGWVRDAVGPLGAGRELKPWPTPGGVVPQRNAHPRDVWAEAEREYRERLDAFVGVG